MCRSQTETYNYLDRKRHSFACNFTKKYVRILYLIARATISAISYAISEIIINFIIDLKRNWQFSGIRLVLALNEYAVKYQIYIFNTKKVILLGLLLQ